MILSVAGCIFQPNSQYGRAGMRARCRGRHWPPMAGETPTPPPCNQGGDVDKRVKTRIDYPRYPDVLIELDFNVEGLFTSSGASFTTTSRPATAAVSVLNKTRRSGRYSSRLISTDMARSLYLTVVLLAVLTCLYAFPVQAVSQGGSGGLAHRGAETLSETRSQPEASGQDEGEDDDACSNHDEEDGGYHNGLRRRCIGKQRKPSWPWARKQSQSEVEGTATNTSHSDRTNSHQIAQMPLRLTA